MDLYQVQAERFDLGQHAVQGGAVQQADKYGVGAVPLRHQCWERRQYRGAEVAVDPDRVPGGRWVHNARVADRWVNRHHQDLVTAGLACAAG